MSDAQRSNLNLWTTNIHVAIKIFFITVLLLIVSISPTPADHVPKVLVLHSYHQGYHWTDIIQEGFSRTLSQQFPQVEGRVESMAQTVIIGLLVWDLTHRRRKEHALRESEQPR